MAHETQSFENHAKIVPGYSYGLFGLIALYLVWAAYRAIVAFSIDTVVAVVLGMVLVMLGLYARVFALAVQDRVIRLEERLRFARLAPDLAPRFDEFTVNQLCSLRFASDDELPELARKVLAERLDDRKAIKKMIRVWRADHWRA